MSDQITVKITRPESGDYASLPDNISLDDLEAAAVLPILGLAVSEQPCRAIDTPDFKWNDDHDCSHVPEPLDADWDSDGSEDTGFLMAQNTHHRILTPLVVAQMWMFNRTYTLARKYMSDAKRQ